MIFRILKDGGDFQVLHAFVGKPLDGAVPVHELLAASDRMLYGTTEYGGAADQGTLFRMATDGIAYQMLRSFTTQAADSADPGTPAEAEGGVLYGMTGYGGVFDRGMVYRTNPDGTQFVELWPFVRDGGNGYRPYGPMAYAGTGVLYGATSAGGSADLGTVFRLAQGPPRITSIALHGVTCRIEMRGVPGFDYRCEIRSALQGADWSTLCDCTANTNGMAVAVHSNAVPSASRFYRFLSPQPVIDRPPLRNRRHSHDTTKPCA